MKRSSPAGVPKPCGDCSQAKSTGATQASADAVRNQARLILIASYSVLNVLVEQLKLRALLAYFDAHDVAHREHPDELVAVNDGQVAAADHLHAFERIVRRVVALDDRARLAHHVAYRRVRGVELVDDDAF